MSNPDIKSALQAVQKILREANLQGLAAQVPIKAATDLQVVRGRLRGIDALLRLRPPPKATQDVLKPALEALQKQLETKQ